MVVSHTRTNNAAGQSPVSGDVARRSARSRSGACLYYAVYKDAAARGANATGWGAAIFLLAPIGGPVYAVYRRRLPDRTDPPGWTERLLGAVGIGGITAVLFSTSITPPDPISNGIDIGGA